MKETHLIENQKLFLPYFLPYIAYTGVATLLEPVGIEWNYGLRIVIVAGLIIWGWKRYVPLCGPGNVAVSVVWGVVAGLAGLCLWILMMEPFLKPNPTPWKPTAFYLRLFAASLLVPVFEELLMRGYVFRVAYQWAVERRAKAGNALGKVLAERSINDFVPGAWNLWALVISSVVFALGHHMNEWPAAILYGLLMSLLWILRKDLISCVVAHGTTNLGLGIYVYVTQRWEFW